MRGCDYSSANLKELGKSSQLRIQHTRRNIAKQPTRLEKQAMDIVKYNSFLTLSSECSI